MVKNILIIVPHEDDELNLVGCILNQLLQVAYINVAYVTNGDYYLSKTNKRIEETLKVGELLGLHKQYFLGYPDQLSGRHLYNENADSLVISNNGMYETYGVGDTTDFHFMYTGKHNLYTLENLKSDLKNLIEQLKCDMIFCVDFDSHPDHRMVSLVFDEIMCELLRFSSYRPIILKKFAYIGAWGGINDYFSIPLPCALPFDANKNSIVDECLPYEWNAKISIKSDDDLIRHDYWNCVLYKALKIYKTQKAVRHFFAIANSDTVYWYRNTNNLSITSKIEVSSGEKKYINDFKLCETTDVCNQQKNYLKFSECAWVPNDDQKYVLIDFCHTVNLRTIIIYQNFYNLGHINEFKISLSNGYTFVYNCDKSDICKISVPGNHYIEWVKITIINSIGILAGIREIETYDSDCEFPWEEVPLKKFIENQFIDNRNVYLLRIQVVFFFFLNVPHNLKKIFILLRNKVLNITV